MHQATLSGIVQLKFIKKVSFSTALNNWKMIVDKSLRTEIRKLIQQKHDKKKIVEFFNHYGNSWKGKDLSKIEIYYWENDNVASRNAINDSFHAEKIKSITDTGIQAIMLQHLQKYQGHPEQAFSPDGLEEMNKNVITLNGGKFHQPIYKVRTFEPKGNKFAIGQRGIKKKQYAEAAKGTNLYYAVYLAPNGKRSYETIPLNIVIERRKQGLGPVPETSEAGHLLLFYLSPNDLVYLPEIEEINGESKISIYPLRKAIAARIYKVVSFTGSRLYCIPHYVAVPIVDKFEFTQLNKVEFTPEKISIREICLKLKTDRLGNVEFITR